MNNETEKSKNMTQAAKAVNETKRPMTASDAAYLQINQTSFQQNFKALIGLCKGFLNVFCL